VYGEVWDANTGQHTRDLKQCLSSPLSEITVAEVIRDAGYLTAFYWHLGDFKKLDGDNKKRPISHPGQHGFEKWWATERSAPTL